MKITLIRQDNGSGKETLSVCEAGTLFDKMKTETKAGHITALRGIIPLLEGTYARYEHIDKLPYIYSAVEYTRTKEGERKMKRYNGLVQLEVSRLASGSEVEFVKRQAALLPQTFAAFGGSSGRSVKIWVRFALPDDGGLPTKEAEAELFHVHAYWLAVKCYQPMLPFDIDLKEPVLAQRCRMTLDESPYYNPDAVPFCLEQPLTMPGEETFRQRKLGEKNPLLRLQPGYESAQTFTKIYEAALNRALQEMEDWKRGDDLQPLLVRLAEHCFKAGLPEEEAIRQTMIHYYREEEEQVIRSILHNLYQECKGFGKKSSISKEQETAFLLEEFMNRRYEFRYNTQIGEVEYRERFSFQFYFHSIDKRAQNSIMLDAQSEGIGVWDRDIDRYLHSNRVPIYNPLEEFLFHLPHWDGKDRIHALANRVPCKNPHWELLFHRWFLNMVSHWRGIDKMHANNTSPILVGRQGTHKSTFCREMIPPALRAYYTDSIDFSHKRDAELYLNRFALINIDEFDQITLPQQGFLKHILQKPVVNLRKPHGRSVLELQRYASFIGTSNQKDLLTDPSGSRRVICIEVTGNIDTTQPIDYEQLYAQAMYELDHGERYWFDQSEEQIMTKSNREFEQVPPEEQLFFRYFRAAQPEEGEWLSPAEIMEDIQKGSSIPMSVKRVNSFGRILKKQEIPSKHTRSGTLYHVVRLITR